MRENERVREIERERESSDLQPSIFLAPPPIIIAVLQVVEIFRLKKIGVTYFFFFFLFVFSIFFIFLALSQMSRDFWTFGASDCLSVGAGALTSSYLCLESY